MRKLTTKIKCVFSNKQDMDNFLSLVAHMEKYGNIGHTTWLGIEIDGDGCSHPKFKFKNKQKYKDRKGDESTYVLKNKKDLHLDTSIEVFKENKDE